MSLLYLLFRLLGRSSKPARPVVYRPLYPPPAEKPFRKPAANRGPPILPEPVDARPERIGFQVHRVGHEITGRCFFIDGDTITIGSMTIRLAGIDAPEMDHPYGKKARWELMQLCRGQTIRAVCDGSLSHERGVATCYLPDGRDLSAEMVRLGMALDWPKFSGGRYRPLEPPESRKLLWRVDARQKGRLPPVS